MKRKKKRPRFTGESFLGKWELTVDPDKVGYVVTNGEFSRVYPNFDSWSEDHGLVATRRQLEIERDYFGTILFTTQEHAIAAAMNLSAPDDHKTGGVCDCVQCIQYKNEALARKIIKRPSIEI
jgi:hypothetical protein